MGAAINRLRDERGQSLVFFLIFLPSLILVVALVVNIGVLLQASRHAQSVADAAALAAAQELPSANVQAVAANYADANWPGFTADPQASLASSTSSPGAGSEDVTVRVSHPVSGFFGSILSLAGFTVGAHATARAQVAASVDSLTPLGVEAGPGCSIAPLASCTFRWAAGRNAQNTFAPVRVSGVTNVNQLSGLLGCDALQPTASNCFQDSNGIGLGSYRVLNLNNGNGNGQGNGNANVDAFVTALQGVQGISHLVAVYDTLTGTGRTRSMNVIGWAALTIDDVSQPSNTSIEIDGHFTKLLLDNLPDGASSQNPPDFGVHAVGLID
jgi:Flp pilus assembly protein TadG